MIKQALISTVFLVASATAGATDTNPRLTYMTQMCHHSTSAALKTTLRKTERTVDAYCGCVAEKSVMTSTWKADHSFALAYHEVNIVFERTLRYEQSAKDIDAEMRPRLAGYARDYGITSAEIERLSKPALKILTECLDDTVSAGPVTMSKADLGLRY